ncbi:bifunctional diaminohydroxyphosphoribosylaminopyrimidine deaminase/5-amino-6-(5-phosphoribosylamino)uracil reductase RibD [Salipiger sp. IMCC34102]|uniref:bifunctional diaminohydroxyphosphoribosylaminopyrimidine deaminase/5-amino-6-(5-phosphoribosylamino)uracil reductase RibD n=1 Tax=Salipiger sp. IMCC34102 TaxID=2510647 RepID=UPI00101C4FDF|nr:bifunctional diaminohydroxyphosphoribosylaminopyrimidine deaminase/5-amino-6-(5-phosphoribosylamino)uracil reductase RibD [Salipiger sp. IMCC34102]RYH02346.1 bifunctional diaminohydroxyphosphoribosylaminopyrimidine deaminase/5-amino-6-(5-phosphoribosylamino)uracil reductase RibD [Salipiger sp. IMCC34102]
MTDTRFMALAISLGARGLGRTWPNPSVGCVLVKDGIIVGRGTTARGGRPHAERVALDQAGEAARGATAYVTLEPCAHTGQTPPCARALVEAGVARVVIGTGDPDPRVAGAGIQILRDAGITVDTGPLEAEARALHAGFLKRVTTGRPWVTLKLASTLDGRIATTTGESRWITGPQSRRVVHGLRARHDAVMIGGGTARADDPSLDVRDLGEMRQPVRIVLSRDLNLPVNSRLTKTAAQQPVWLFHCAGAQTRPWSGTEVDLIEVAQKDHQVDLHAALAQMGARGLTRVLCEGGGHLAASLLHFDLVDEIILMQAGCAIGSDGLPSLAGMGVRDLSTAPRFDLIESRTLGQDTLTRWHPRRAVPA